LSYSFRSAPKQEVRKTFQGRQTGCSWVSLCSQTGGSQNKEEQGKLEILFRSAPKQEVRKTFQGRQTRCSWVSLCSQTGGSQNLIS